MKKIDFKKERKALYSAPKNEAVLVEVPKMNFLTIEGEGDPNNSETMQSAAEALYGTAYSLKFSFKKADKPANYFDYVVPPLEGLWWMKGNKDFDMDKKEDWLWALMVMQPDFVTKKMAEKAVDELKEKKDLPALSKLKFETFEEGLCAQIMHIGSYSEEEPTLKILHQFIAEKGYELNGRHHEIYLSDPRKTAPEKLRTVLRHPVKK